MSDCLILREGFMVFTDEEKKMLEMYVTSAEDPIYAVRNTVPPEIFGAFGSYFSRNPKDFRENLLEALYGTLDEGLGYVDGSGTRIEKIGAPAALEEMIDPALALKSGLLRSQDFFRRWYGKYSHKSIANVVWIPMVATGVSQLFARELAYDQLAFFIEQSTRYCGFDTDAYFDPEIRHSQHGEIQFNALVNLRTARSELTSRIKDHYIREIPFEIWRESQSDSVRKQRDDQQRRKYEREIDGKTFDSTRFLLPQAILTNIAWIFDARSAEYDIAAWKNHPLIEMREAAASVEKHVGQIAPSLLKYTDASAYYGDKLRNYDGDLARGKTPPFEKGVDIISIGDNSLDALVAHLLKRNNVGGTFRNRLEAVSNMSFSEKMTLLERVTKNRGTHDEWIEMDEDADLVKVAFEIRTDVGAVRDWRRHQKWDRGEALYTLANGYTTPPVINEIGGEAQRIFGESMRVVQDSEEKLGKIFSPWQAQYVVPMAANHAITFSGGLDQLQYMLWTRSTPEGNWSYRQDAFNVAEAVVKEMPWLLGYEHYPEGKTFLEVYEDAPLKNLLRLQTGGLKLHQ